MAVKVACALCGRQVDPRGLDGHMRAKHDASSTHPGGPFSGASPSLRPSVDPETVVEPELKADADVRQASKQLALAKFRRALREVEAPVEVEQALAAAYRRLEALEAKVSHLEGSDGALIGCFERIWARLAAIEQWIQQASQRRW